MTKLFTQVEFQDQEEMKKLKLENRVAYDKMKRIGALQELIDSALTLDAEIKAIEKKELSAKQEKLIALKQKIERGIELEGIKHLDADLGRATRSQSTLEVFNEDGFNKKFNIKPEDIAEFTTKKLGKPSVRLYPNKK